MDRLLFISPIHVYQRILLLYQNSGTHQYALGNDSRHAMKSFKSCQNSYFVCVTFDSANK